MIGDRLAASFGAVVMMIGGLVSAAPGQTKPPAELFAVLPVTPPRISPDGTHFALIRGIDGRQVVAVYNVGSPQMPPQIFGSNSWSVSALTWAKNDVLMIFDRKIVKTSVSEDLRSFGNVIAVTLNKGPMNSFANLARIEDINLDSPDMIYGSSASMLFEANVRTGWLFKVHLGPRPPGGTGTAWLMDGHGNVAGRLDSTRDEKDGLPLFHTTLMTAKADDWRIVGKYDTTLDQGGGAVGLSADGQSFLRLASNDAGTNSLTRIDMSTGMEAGLVRDPNYDVAAMLKDDWTGRIIGYVIDEDMPVYRYFDPKREAFQKGLEQAFPGLSVHAVSADLVGDKAIVEVTGPKTPSSYYLYNRATHQAAAIAANYPDLTDSEMGEVKPYGYTAGDGVHVPAYLTLPPGKPLHNLPLVVVPHGGLYSRDDMTFDYFRQFLASRGYVVLQPEYRGTRGFGRTYSKTAFGQWGMEIESDISDGVKKVISEGIADPKRICILGGDFGGYISLAGAMLKPELYSCVVSFAGPSNLSMMIDYSRKKRSALNADFWLTRNGGDSVELDAESPALHADRITASVLLLHDAMDYSVPVEQSEIMAAALQKAGKKVEFLRLPGDDHNLTLEQSRAKILQEVEKFLSANIGS